MVNNSSGFCRPCTKTTCLDLYKYTSSLNFLLLHYKRIGGKSRGVPLALFFCMLGDCMLLIDHMNYYLAALTSFWGACILFLLAILKGLGGNLLSQITKKKIIFPMLLFMSILGGVMFYIFPYIKNIAYPVLLYAFTLAFSCGLSGLLWLEKRNKPTLFIFLGCLLLNICCSLVLINKVILTDESYRFLEVLLYFPSLYLISLGLKDSLFNENI